VFLASIGNIFKDLRLVAFLLIFSCFWLMFMQLFDLLPNFIDEWVNTSDVAPAARAIGGWLHLDFVQANGQVKPEIIVNIDAVSIILLVIPISWAISRMHKVLAMIIGMLIALVGFVGSGTTDVGWICCLMIFIFAIGEMICSPTFSAYVGLIAPPDRKALYMGYSNIPFAIGWALGNLLSGYAYEHFSSKVNLARDYMVRSLGMLPDLIKNDQASRPNASSRVSPMSSRPATRDRPRRRRVTGPAGGDGPAARGASQGGLRGIARQVDMSALQQATQVLWNTYHPQIVWYWLGAVGLIGTVG